VNIRSWTWSGGARTGSVLVAGVVLTALTGCSGTGTNVALPSATTARPAGASFSTVQSGSVLDGNAIQPVSLTSARDRVWSAGYGYRISVSSKRLSSHGHVTSESISIRVTGGRNVRVRAQLQQTLNLAVQKLEHDFSTDVADRPTNHRPSRQKVTVTQLDSWGWLGSITLRSQETLWGSVNRVHTLLLTQDLRTAKGITATQLFAHPTAADRATRAALVAAGLPRATAAHVTFGVVKKTDVPVLASATSRGLRVALVQCSGTCPTVVVPWKHLPATKHGVLPRTR
jgi:hypothetical protein